MFCRACAVVLTLCVHTGLNINRHDMEAATARQLARALRPGWNDLAVSWLGDNRPSPDEAQHDDLNSNQGTDDMEQEAEEEEKLPKEWLCPITGQLMQDPAVTSCGHLFDRTAIHQWLTKVLPCRIPCTAATLGYSTAYMYVTLPEGVADHGPLLSHVPQPALGARGVPMLPHQVSHRGAPLEAQNVGGGGGGGSGQLDEERQQNRRRCSAWPALPGAIPAAAALRGQHAGGLRLNALHNRMRLCATHGSRSSRRCSFRLRSPTIIAHCTCD